MHAVLREGLEVYAAREEVFDAWGKRYSVLGTNFSPVEWDRLLMTFVIIVTIDSIYS
jgi:hypothetical protein